MTNATDSDELMQLVFLALDHGIRSVEGGGPMTPFVVCQGLGGEGRELHRFVAETLEESQERAREFCGLLGEETVAAALAYDGYLTCDGVRTDAIFVSVHAAGRDVADTFAQRYAHRGEAVEEIGNAKHVAIDDPPLLRVAPPSAPRPSVFISAAQPKRGLRRLLGGH